MAKAKGHKPERNRVRFSTATKTPPPEARARWEPAPTGRPPVWNGMLHKYLRGIRPRRGPYKNESTAIAAAGAFNEQMRSHEPKSYQKGIRFRGRHGYVVVRKINL